MNVPNIYYENLPEAYDDKKNDECFIRYENGDLEAKNEIILHNLRIVAYTIKSYKTNYCYSVDDLISVGTEGLIKSVETYDRTTGISFYPYAKQGIRNYITTYIRKEIRRQANSLDEDIYIYDNGRNLDRISTLKTDNSVEENIINCILIEEIKKILYSLPEKFKLPIIMYYGIDNNKICTQGQIANTLGISRQIVNVYIKRGLQMIKEQMDDTQKPIQLAMTK